MKWRDPSKLLNAVRTKSTSIWDRESYFDHISSPFLKKLIFWSVIPMTYSVSSVQPTSISKPALYAFTLMFFASAIKEVRDRESYEDMVLHSALRITPSAVLATIPPPSVDTHSSLMRREPSTVLSVQTEWDRES